MSIAALLNTRPFIVVVGVLLVLIGGWTSFRALPVDLLPSLNYPLINIVTRYPAGTAQDAELLLTRPIESAVSGLSRIKRFNSLSAPGLSQITVEFSWGTDVLTAREEVSSALASVLTKLPLGARPQIENIGSSLAAISTFTLSGPVDPVTMRNWVQYTVAPTLERLPGIARVQVMGGGVAAMRVDLDPARMRAHGVSTGDALEAIRASNILESGGVITQHGRDLLVTTHAQVRDPKALENVLLRRAANGVPIVLGDVSRIYRGEVPQRYAITRNRQAAVAFMVQKQQRASTMAVSTAVDAALAKLTPPHGAKIEKFYDQAEIIGLAYRNMRNELLAGAVLSLLALFFFLGRNYATLILSITIPLSVVGVFILLGWAGLGVNLMTLGALTVSIGMIADDGILVLENIFRHWQLGKTPSAAAQDGTREILGADIAGTFVVVVTFVPLVFLQGLAGRLFQPFGLTFGSVLALSLVFSLTLIPWSARRLLPSTGGSATTSTSSGQWLIDRAIHHNRQVLDFLLRRRAVAIGVSVLLMLGSVALLAFNPVRFLPLLDEQSLLLSYQLAPGTSLAESNRVGDTLEAMALAQPGVTAVYRRTGSPAESYFLEGPEAGELVIRLAPDGAYSAESVRDALYAKVSKIPGVLTRMNEPTSEKIEESLSGLPVVFGLTVSGNDLAALHKAADLIERAARKVPGIASVFNSTKVPLDRLDVTIDRAAAARLGVTPQNVARAVRVAVQGLDAGQSVIGGKVVHIYVRYDKGAMRQPRDLDHVLVKGAAGALIPLSQVAHVTPSTAYSLIEHRFGSRALTLTLDFSGNPISVLSSLDKAIANLPLPPDVHVAYTGEYREMIDTAQQLVLILLASALLVFGIMVLQFGNLIDPAVILIKLPIDVMGASLMLFATRQSLDLTVMIGLVTLIGVSVNNGIVLLSFTQQLRASGYSATNAVREAVAVRMRPMLLTQLTSLLGMLPAALGIGHGPQLLQPLAIMLLGGLAMGAFLTLNLVPVLYVTLERFRRSAPVTG